MAIGDNTKYGRVLAEWTVPEFIKYKRTLGWFIIAGGLAVILLVHALATRNFLFAIIILIITAIVYLHERRQPDDIEFMILEGGVVLGDKYYPYKELTGFWLIYEPPVKLLYLGVNQTLRKELPIHLENQNPLVIRKLLLNYVDEDLEREDESTEEALARLMRL
ncbi:MAG: hypothetical protein ACD_41C00344G0009 [uncultured bacterium]|nr:MAG: hypothetical protein ACD_41C00344G0009 [uncultured bacterium]HBY73898.1 hypothetical protein [Candidatus Kerfeldbacteria bacterium]